MTRILTNALILSPILIALGSCTTIPAEWVSSELDNTDWVLIGFHQPGDEANLNEVGLYDYTMHLDASGAAQFKFDCNSGSSSWKATSLENGKGAISFGVVAATTALCADDGVGEKLASDVRRFARYSLYDARLTISPESSGPIYVWDSVD